MSLSTDNSKIEDYLDEDRPISGQRYVCLSFVSPENVLEDKKLYTLYKFMKSQNPDMDMEYEKFKDEYKNFGEDNEDEIQSEFDSENQAVSLFFLKNTLYPKYQKLENHTLVNRAINRRLIL